jgi:type VI secretion system protein ImpC
VNNTETDEMLKIRVLSISKNELGKTIKRFKGTAWDQSPLFKKVYEQEYGQLGGEPYGCLIGDYHFDHSPPDVEILGGMAQIAAAAHAPFLAGAAPSVMQMESWQELTNPRDLTKIFTTPEYAALRSLRESEDARYLGLAMPRFLARLPYGTKTDPVEEFDFEEDTEGADSTRYTWANSAYAMAVNINRAFKQFGWCSRIRGVESGGSVEGLPVHTFPSDDGGVDMKCPTEIAISDRREAELAKNGFMPLIHRKNSDFAAFIGAQSLQKPAEYDDPDATANAALAARLPYLFASCRFAHYLKCIVRDKVGSFKERAAMEKWLNDWILQYVDGDPANSSEEVKARKPLAGAHVVVEEVEGNPGYYTSKFYLRPHYQLEGLTVSLRLVSKLPSEKAA